VPFELDAARTIRGGLAGVIAAGVWALQQPLDKRVFGSRYDDVELLGRAAVRGDDWRGVGLALHLQNGALFGAVYANVASRLPLPRSVAGPVAGLAEHVGLWPLVGLTDRVHPARASLPRLSGNRRAFWQAAWRHALFGFVLGEVERRLNPDPPEPEPAEPEPDFSTNGHGNIEHAVSVELST
jgi:hypothetical protein